MIAYITGKVIKKDSNSIIIENNGIGYEVVIPLSTFYRLQEDSKAEQVSLYIYPHLKDETWTLFGFYTLLEKRLFMMLKSVAGIGPRLAINILSGTGPEELLDAIVEKDVSRLCRIPGIGKKTAQRIVLELSETSRSLLEEEGLDIKEQRNFEDVMIKDALSALVNLGYPEDKATKAIKNVYNSISSITLETLIKESLKIIGA